MGVVCHSHLFLQAVVEEGSSNGDLLLLVIVLLFGRQVCCFLCHYVDMKIVLETFTSGNKELMQKLSNIDKFDRESTLGVLLKSNWISGKQFQRFSN